MFFIFSLLSFFLYQLSALGLISKSLACSRAIRWGQTSGCYGTAVGEGLMYPDSMVGMVCLETPGSRAGLRPWSVSLWSKLSPLHKEIHRRLNASSGGEAPPPPCPLSAFTSSGPEAEVCRLA